MFKKILFVSLAFLAHTTFGQAEGKTNQTSLVKTEADERPVCKICIDQHLPSYNKYLFINCIMALLVYFIAFWPTIMIVERIIQNRGLGIGRPLLSLVAIFCIFKLGLYFSNLDNWVARNLNNLFVSKVRENDKSFILLQDIGPWSFIFYPRNYTKTVDPNAKLVFVTKQPWAQKYCDLMNEQLAAIEEPGKGWDAFLASELLKKPSIKRT